MAIAILGIDLGKNSYSAGQDATGRVVLRRRMRRETVLTFYATLPAYIVAIEVCCGAHHMGRVLRRARPHRPTDVARVCAPLRQGAQERRPRR